MIVLKMCSYFTGGLPDEDVRSLDGQQIDAISPKAIRNLSPTIFEVNMDVIDALMTDIYF
jgi:hypothetical protein